MKKINWHIIIFICLLIMLVTGLSYLAFSEVSTDTDEDEEDLKKMSIALVNEDEGANFGGDNIVFGDEFVQSINKDDTHDWYVVSRGVAENGLKRNAYEMMIIIPNNFSEKALSIYSENPERVVLNYKINASGHKEIRAEAEKTASVVLNDFNRRLIDVYFASIIGNLQDAQDHIATIVDKERKYTNVYRNKIYSPLSDYTNRFQSVQDYTNLSKENYSNVEEILKTFHQDISESTNQNEDVVADVTDFRQLSDENSKAAQLFYESLDQFRERMNHPDVVQQMNELKRLNEAVHRQFPQKLDDEELEKVRTIASDSYAINQYFNQATEEVKTLENSLQEILKSDLNERVRQRLKTTFDDSFKDNQLFINTLFKQLDKNIKNEIEKHTDKLPYLDDSEIDEYYLPEKTITELKNTIQVMKKEGVVPKREQPSYHFLNLKKHLDSNPIEITDTVKIPNSRNLKQVFKMNVEEGFEIVSLILQLPDGEEHSYTNEFKQYGKVELPPTQKGNLTVKLTLKLKDNNKEFDIFKPITWDWSIHQKGRKVKVKLPPFWPYEDVDVIEEEESPQDLNEEDLPQNPGANEEDTEQVPDEVNPEEPEEPEDLEEPAEPENPEEDPTDEEEDPPAEDPDAEDPNDEENPEDDDIAYPPIYKIIKKKDNYVYSKVMSPMVDTTTQTLIDEVAEIITAYQKLASIYEMYYGFNMSDEQLAEKLKDQKPSSIASESSFYYLLNQKDVTEIVNDFFVNHVTDKVTEQVREPIGSLHEKIFLFRQRMDEADIDSDKLVEKVLQLVEDTQDLNTNLTELLAKVVEWHETNATIQEEQTKVINKRDGEQTAIMSLDEGLQSLLLSSNALADQAKDNVNIADTVYKVFDDVDKEAEDIKKSGVTIVNDAVQLADDLTGKLADDENFANNFQDVLANSRVGDRQNENLYSFLSNPVRTKVDGVMVRASDTFKPYFLVLVLSIVSLFTAYVISTFNEKRQEAATFETEKSIVSKNLPITLVSAVTGIIEGIIIGVLSVNLLQANTINPIFWIVLITLIMVALVLISTYLLRQLKIIGMFLLIMFLSLYLFLTESLGFSFNKGFVENLKAFSPLQYIEILLMKNFTGAFDDHLYTKIFISIIVCLILGSVINLFVVHPSKKEETVEEE